MPVINTSPYLVVPKAATPGVSGAVSAGLVDAEFWTLIAGLEGACTMPADMRDGTHASSPGLLGDIDTLFDSFAASPGLGLALGQGVGLSAAAAQSLARLDSELAVEVSAAAATTTGFDTSLLQDPTVTELAARFLEDKDAFAYAQQIVKSISGGALPTTTPMKKKQRRPKQDVPAHMKDEKYYRKREANTKAARRTRERAKLQKSLKAVGAAADVHGNSVAAQMVCIQSANINTLPMITGF